jgi:signal transduction histidine kinase
VTSPADTPRAQGAAPQAPPSQGGAQGSGGGPQAPSGAPAAAPRFLGSHPLVADPVSLSVTAALVFVVAGLLTLLTRGAVPAGYRAGDHLFIALTVATALPLALLWWSPLAALCGSAALLVAQAVAGYQFTQAALLAVVAASFVTVLFDAWRRVVVAGFVVAAAFVVVVVTSPTLSWQEALARWLLLSVVWGLAGVLRLSRASAARAERRAELLSADRDARARDAVAQERARLARELHDSVGHALNVVVLHAGAARRLVNTKPELVPDSLASIETAGRQALGDIERMLGILRTGDEQVSHDAVPGMGELQVLCAQVGEAGLPVQLTVEGQARPLPPSLDLTAYRIVQESLTNTLKHAGRTRAQVTVRYEADNLAIEVLDEGRGVPAGAAVGGGRGLLGMRERVLIFGGELQAGPRAQGGFAVRARLPLQGEGT